MLKRLRRYSYLLLGWVLLFAGGSVNGQSGNSGSIEGTVTDPSGAVIAGATVEITNPVSGYKRTAETGMDGTFRFSNVPFNPYHLTVSSDGVHVLQPGCGRAFIRADGDANIAKAGRGGDERNGGSLGRRPGGERLNVPHRRGSRACSTNFRCKAPRLRSVRW